MKNSQVKLIGILCLLIGAILLAVGLIDFFAKIGTGVSSKLIWLAFLGLPAFGFGLGLTVSAFKTK